MSDRTSDKNVANIEDDIKYVKEMLEIARVFFKAVKAETDYKDVDEIAFCNAVKHILAEREQMLKEREKYTIRLTDEEYRKVIENAQMDTSNDKVIAHKFAVMQQQINEKDKRIQELEEENADLKKYNKTVSDRIVEYKKNSIPTQVVTDLIQEYKDKIERYDEYRIQGKETDVEYYENIANTAIVQVLQELLEGER